MRKIIKTSSVIVLAVIWSLVANPTLAQERMKIIEMGESCQQVQFSMSEEECAAEDAAKARLGQVRARRIKEESKIRSLSYEMCESGERISFPMSAEEIQMAISREAEQLKAALAREKKPKVSYDEVELCESGEKIIFFKSP
jgi:hypothetical protein